MADVQWEPDWEQQALREARPAMRRINHAIASDMLRLVPRKTGELADSIEEQEVGDDRYRVKFGTDHWEPNEYGTRHMAAQPYARPAFYKKREL